MYTIYVDGNLLYSPERVSDGYVVTSAVLTREVNCADTFEFTMPTSNPAYSSLVMFKSLIRIYRDDNTVFIGRAISANRGLYDLITYHCEGGLGLLKGAVKLVDWNVRVYDFLNSVSYYHSNAWVTFMRAGLTSNMPAGVTRNYQTRDYLKKTIGVDALDYLLDTLVNEYGGHFDVEYREELRDGLPLVKIYWFDVGKEPLNSQTIEFRKNIIDITQNIDFSNFTTVYKPVKKGISHAQGGSGYSLMMLNGYDGEGVHGNYYIPDESILQTYGVSTEIVQYEDNDNINSISALYSAIKDYASKKAVSNISFDVKAIDLNFADNTIPALVAGQRNRIISAPNGIDQTILCSKTVENLLDPTANQYGFGSTIDVVTSMIKSNTVQENSKNINMLLNSIASST